MNFRIFIFTILFFAGINFSCKENEYNFQSSAVITGVDVRDCMCCGGYFIDIEDSTYNFNVLPANSDIDLTMENFPVSVKLDWDYANKCGDIQYIEISRIEKE